MLWATWLLLARFLCGFAELLSPSLVAALRILLTGKGRKGSQRPTQAPSQPGQSALPESRGGDPGFISGGLGDGRRHPQDTRRGHHLLPGPECWSIPPQGPFGGTQG